jgi:squalene-associated FAD-dependent desaturase
MRAPVWVVGAGWAGLACALALQRTGRPVGLIEAAREPGGRARRVERAGETLDNGQHLLIGAYEGILGLLAQLGIAERDVLDRHPLSLALHDASGPVLVLRAPRWPAPLHLLAALLGAEGLSPGERLRALTRTRLLLAGPDDGDCDLAGFLQRSGQPERLTRALWSPLCRAALNTPPEQASAAVFARVLRETFTGGRARSDLLIPRRDLGALLPRPALQALAAGGAELRLGERLLGLWIEGGRLRGLRLRTGPQPAGTVVLATPHLATAGLLEEHPALAPLARDLRALEAEPTTTVYLRYPSETRLGEPMRGLLDGPAHWVFDRATAGQPGVMAVVLSGSGPCDALPKAELAQACAHQLARHLPGGVNPEVLAVIRERRATFRCSPGSNALRPGHRTVLPGLWLAGDYTDTGLPATLEGAVRSGLECARQLIGEDA